MDGTASEQSQYANDPRYRSFDREFGFRPFRSITKEEVELKVELEPGGIVDVCLDHNSTCSLSRLPH